MEPKKLIPPYKFSPVLEFDIFFKSKKQFKVSVQDMDSGTPIKGGSFTTKKAAKAFVREMKKLYDLINHGGYIVNYNTRKELITNY